MKDPVYLDYNATTPVDPRVAEAMLPYLKQHWGNPSASAVRLSLGRFTMAEELGRAGAALIAAWSKLVQ
jgi:cysteine desulfurase